MIMSATSKLIRDTTLNIQNIEYNSFVEMKYQIWVMHMLVHE